MTTKEKNIIQRAYNLMNAADNLLNQLEPATRMELINFHSSFNAIECARWGTHALKEVCEENKIKEDIALYQYMVDVLPTIRIECSILSKDVYINGKYLDISKSLRLHKHSPDGFNWGYMGSGPSQLALAILLEFLPVEFALNIYQVFKALYVSTWPQNDSVDIDLKLPEIINNCINEMS